jgi:glycosyltransferase involved in cell wall biosynthesis
MIRIAFFAEILIEEFDGASRTMFQILKRIPQQDFEFLFICGTGPDQIFGYECMRVPAVTIPLNSTYKMAVPALASSKIKRKLDTFRPDVVHIATPSSLGKFALEYANARSIPVMTIYHTHFISYVDYYLRFLPFLIPSGKRWVSGFLRRFYNACSLIYIPSESIAEELYADGLQRDLVKIWKRGINAQLFHPAKRDAAYMQSLTGNQKPVILFASRLVWEKNLQILLDLNALLQERKLPYQIVVAGDGVAASACKKAMPAATFLGTLDHETLARVYASSDVFFFPSVSESYGNVVLEAMASGLPCVIADGGGSRDFIEPGVTGFKCPPYEAAAYLKEIELILTDATLAQKLSDNGRAYSVTFDWEVLVNQYFTDVKALASAQKTAP